jgi:hypothetical protein
MYGGAALVATLFVATDWARVEAPDWSADTAFAAAPAPRTVPRRSTDFSVIWRRMEPPASATPQPPATPIQAPAQVGYEVVATFCESQPEFSFAVLRDATKKQRLVKTGETVGGMKVVSISKEGVLVLQGGVQMLLKTVEASTGLPVAPAPAVSSADWRPTFVGGGAAQPGPAAAVTPVTTPQPAAAAEEEDPFALTREELEKYVNNLPTLLSQMELATHLDAERKPDGLQIISLQPQSVAAERGLLQGDIVKMIYDVAITAVGQLPPLARKILADDPAFIEMVIERDGNEKSLVYEVR